MYFCKTYCLIVGPDLHICKKRAKKTQKMTKLFIKFEEIKKLSNNKYFTIKEYMLFTGYNYLKAYRELKKLEKQKKITSVKENNYILTFKILKQWKY